MEVEIITSLPSMDNGIVIYPEDNQELEDLIEFLDEHGCVINDEE